MAKKKETTTEKALKMVVRDSGQEYRKTVDARFIDAGPDLLAACKAALRLLKRDGYEPHHYDGHVLLHLKSAIKRAEGK